MRVLPHHDGLVNLRSFDERAGSPGGMQEARYESGLDNSPMYDCGSADQGDGCEYWNTTTGSMELLDVGMSSMAAQEAYALATLVRPNGGGEAGVGTKMSAERFCMYLCKYDTSSSGLLSRSYSILLHTRIRYPPRRLTLSTGPTRRRICDPAGTRTVLRFVRTCGTRKKVSTRIISPATDHFPIVYHPRRSIP